MQAVKAVAERYNPRLEISFLDTAGSVDSLNRLERNEAQMVTAEADIIAGPSARSVAVFFRTPFRCWSATMPISNGSRILKGNVLPWCARQGSFRAFMLLAQHFGLRESDFNFIGADEASAERAFARNEADAYFANRPLHAAALTRFVAAGDVSFMPIEDALALHLDVPALRQPPSRGIPIQELPWCRRWMCQRSVPIGFCWLGATCRIV